MEEYKNIDEMYKSTIDLVTGAEKPKGSPIKKTIDFDDKDMPKEYVNNLVDSYQSDK